MDPGMNELENVKIPTDKKALVRYYKEAEKSGKLKTILIEVSTVGKAVARLLRSRKFPVVLCDPRFNESITRDPRKNDKRDSRNLAKKAVFGNYHPVHLTSEKNWDLSVQLRRCLRLRKDMTRKKNQFYSLCKEYFIMEVDADGLIRSEKRRELFLKGEKRPAPQHILRQELDDLRILQARLDTAWEEAETMARKNPAFRFLCELPEVGSSTAITFMAIIDDPFRFEDRRQLWSYAGLGARGQVSGGKRLSSKGLAAWNHELAYTLRRVVDRCKHRDNCFGKLYRDLLNKGYKEKDAFFETVRKVASVMWGILKDPRPFTPDMIWKPFQTSAAPQRTYHLDKSVTNVRKGKQM
jgi:transposase